MSDNNIWIGDKYFMVYVSSVVMKLTVQNIDAVILARGKFISKAVDVAEVVCKKFLQGTAFINYIKSDSTDFINKDNKPVRVSTIEIRISKNE